MLPRLDELEADLPARCQRAIDEGRRGEVEGLDLILKFLRGKRAQGHRAAAMSRVDLGMPTLSRQQVRDGQEIGAAKQSPCSRFSSSVGWVGDQPSSSWVQELETGASKP